MTRSLPDAGGRSEDEVAAWSFLITNLAVVPGLGSVAAGRKIGYVQMTLALVGLLLSGWFVTIAAYSLIKHRVQLVEAAGQGNLVEQLVEIEPRWKWHVGMGAAGFGLFALAWIWALGTSLALLRHARAAHRLPLPGGTE